MLNRKCVSAGCDNPAYHVLGQCGECRHESLVDEQWDYECEQVREDG